MPEGVSLFRCRVDVWALQPETASNAIAALPAAQMHQIARRADCDARRDIAPALRPGPLVGIPVDLSAAPQPAWFASELGLCPSAICSVCAERSARLAEASANANVIAHLLSPDLSTSQGTVDARRLVCLH